MGGKAKETGAADDAAIEGEKKEKGDDERENGVVAKAKEGASANDQAKEDDRHEGV